MAEIRTHFLGQEDKDNHLLSEHVQSTCFICTKHLSSRSNPDQSHNREYSLRAIFKHFKIHQYSKTQSNDNQPVDVVPFCDPCYQIIKTLSSYCADLEILQMRIGYLVNQLNQLTVVEEMSSNIGIIDKARFQFKEKCTSASSYHTGPFVSLPKLNIEQAKTPADQTPEPSSENVSFEEYEPEEEEISSDDQYHSSDVDYELDKNPPSKNKSNKTKRPRSTPTSAKQEDEAGASSKKKIPCLECNCYFQMKSCLFTHSLQFHPEKHFPSETKPDNLTPSQHNMYLTHLFNTAINSCGSWITGYKCTYCPFNTKNKLSIRMHLFKVHQDKLSENLVQLQEDVSPEKLSKIVKLPILPTQNRHGKDKEENIKLQQYCKSKKKMKSEYICSVCKVRTTSPRKHEALHHPEKFLLSKRLENVSPEHFKMYCVYLINKFVETFTKSGADRKVRFHCPHCQKSYIDLQGCRNHMVLGHVDLMSVEIEKLQKNIKPEELKIVKKLERSKPKYFDKSSKKVVKICTMKCDICKVRLTQRGLTLHMKKNHPNEYSNYYSYHVCLVCKQRFRYKWFLEFHKTQCHADVLFEKSRLVNTSMEQFKSYCESVIKLEISSLGKIGTEDGKIRYKCSYCSRSFVDVKHNQIHVVMEHKAVIENKLLELQRSKGMVKIEKGTITKVEECGQIIGEDDGFEATEVFCGKSVTKQEIDENWTEDDEMVDLEDLNENGFEHQGREIKEEDCKKNEEAVLPN